MQKINVGAMEDKIRALLKAYDIRGVYEKELNAENAYHLTRSFASAVSGKKICVSMDTRTSGPKLLKSVIRGLVDCGCSVTELGVVPIPVLGFLTWRRKYDFAVYVSASHNPPEYNGIRFRGSDGAGYVYPREEMYDRYVKKDFSGSSGVLCRKSENELLDEYYRYICGKVKLQRKLKVVLDPGNGSACRMLPMYEMMGCEAIGINVVMDGNFPGRGPNPNEKTLVKTSKLVIEKSADFGVAFDADADRGILIDDKGRFVPPEKIAILIAKYKKYKGNVVAALDCSSVMETELSSLGINVIRVRIGDVFVSHETKIHDAIIGVERSGHFFLPSFQSSDEPFAMSAVIAEMLSKSDKKLSELVDEIPTYPYHSESFEYHLEKKSEILSKINQAVESREKNINRLDGIKITRKNGFVFIRPSNTEPVVRLYVEGKDDIALEGLKKEYIPIIQSAIGR